MTKYTLHKYNHNRSIKQNFEAIETILKAFDKATTNILGEIVGEDFDFELDGSMPYRYMNIKSENYVFSFPEITCSSLKENIVEKRDIVISFFKVASYDGEDFSNIEVDISNPTSELFLVKKLASIIKNWFESC